MPKGIRNDNGLPTALGYRHTEEAKQRISIASVGNQYAKGNTFKHTPEELAKMSKAHLGSSNPMWNTGVGAHKEYIKEQYLAGKSCGDLATEFGVTYQTIAFHIHRLGIMRSRKEAIALGEKQNKFPRFSSGAANPAWRGGFWPNPYPPEFNEKLRERIRDRDNRICQRCGIPESECLRKLDVHHKDGNKLNNIDDNLISLCSSCHAITELELSKYINRSKTTGRIMASRG